MYQQFYNFSAEPFRLSPDHHFAYSHKGYNKARAYLEYAFVRAEGFVMITGKPGTGKTTLIGALVARLADAPVNVAHLVCTQLQADDLLKMVAYEFGIPMSVVEKGEILQRLTLQLKLWHREGRRALLIVDEAQDLSLSAMEELRLLTNIQVESRPLLQIFLLGQPELRKLIVSPRMEQVHQRIIAACHIKPLEADETEAYVRHRLETVNWRGDPAISQSVYPLIFKFSAGVPRRINLICSRLLLHCAVEQQHKVTVADMREVIGELQSEHLATGNGFSESDFQAQDVFEPAVIPTGTPDPIPNKINHVIAKTPRKKPALKPPDSAPAELPGKGNNYRTDSQAVATLNQTMPARVSRPEYEASPPEYEASPPEYAEAPPLAPTQPPLHPLLTRSSQTSRSSWFLEVMLVDTAVLVAAILFALLLVTFGGWN